MKMDQVAIAYRTEEEKAAIKASLGLADKEWIKDVVSADVRAALVELATLPYVEVDHGRYHP